MAPELLTDQMVLDTERPRGVILSIEFDEVDSGFTHVDRMISESADGLRLTGEWGAFGRWKCVASGWLS